MAEHSESSKHENSDSVEESQDLLVENCESMCHGCEDLFGIETLYRCSTCATTETSGPISQIPMNFCDACILAHLRRQHEIVDYRGYRPAVCGAHRKICETFCNKCLELLCLNCTMKHRMHDIQSIAEKAVEVRKAIFCLMDKIEGNSKGIKHREFIATESSKHREDLTESLSDDITATLTKSYDRVIRENSRMWKKIMQKSDFSQMETVESSNKVSETCDRLQALIARTDESLSDLKNMLQMSDGQSVKCFLFKEREAESVNQSQSEEAAQHYYLGWELQFDEIIARSIRFALQRINCPIFKQCTFENLALSREKLSVSERNVTWETLGRTEYFGNLISAYDSNAELFDLVIGKADISFKVFKKTNNDVKSFVSCFEIEQYVIKLPHIHTICKTHEVLSLFGDERARFLNLKTGLKLSEQIKLPENCSLVAVSFFNSLKGYRFIQWDALNSLLSVISQNNKNLREQFCDRKPQSVEHNSVDFLASIDERNNLKLYNTENGLSFEVSHLNHGLSRVDRIQKVGDNWLLMDFKMRMILVCAVDLSAENKISFSIKKAWQLEVPCSSPIQHCGLIDGYLYTFADSTFFATKFNIQYTCPKKF